MQALLWGKDGSAMGELTIRDARLREVARGMARLVSTLPGGRVEGGQLRWRGGRMRLFVAREFEGSDGYSVRGEGDDLEIHSFRPFGFVSGLANLCGRLSIGLNSRHRIVPSFISRFYGHEANLSGGPHHHVHISELDEAFWDEYFGTLAEKHMNGFVVYAGYHPFEYFLDYGEFPEAAGTPKQKRTETLEGLRRMLKTARSYGIKTFLHHFVTHFPSGLARKHGLGVDNPEDDSRLAGLDHPLVGEYSRYAYRRTFELIPELNGLYLCFASAPNASDFVKDCLYPEALRADPLPELVFRLWDFNSLPEMVDLVNSYPGKSRLEHKAMDGSDVYYSPVADRRIFEWRRALPDTEFMFALGPGVTSATMQYDIIWDDPIFVQLLMGDIQKMGADSLCFHSYHDLLAIDIQARRMMNRRSAHMAVINGGHLDHVVQFTREIGHKEGRREMRLGVPLGLTPAAAADALCALKELSCVTLIQNEQFLLTSSREGFLTPPRANFYADPFFYATKKSVNDEATLPMDLRTAWLSTNIRTRYLGDEVMRVIDFVSNRFDREMRSPDNISDVIRARTELGYRLSRKITGTRPKSKLKTFADESRRIYHWGMRIHHEIRAAIELYKAFFSQSKAQVIKDLHQALEELENIRPHVRRKDPLSARKLPMMAESDVEGDIRNLKRLIARLEVHACHYKAFRAYAESLREYNEIRRTVRPSRVVGENETETITTQLSAAIAAAERALGHLDQPAQAALRPNVMRWLEYLRVESACVETPFYDVESRSAVKRNDAFVQLFHDQCFRYGEDCIKDLLGFFVKKDFLRREKIFVRAVSSHKGLVLSLREEDVDSAKRKSLWRKYVGTVSDSYLLRFYIDRAGDSVTTDTYIIHSFGNRVFRESLSVFSRQHTRQTLRSLVEGAEAVFKSGKTWWRLDVTIPWKALGGRPAKGEHWRVNVTSNPAMAGNRQSAWCQGYEFLPGKSARMGTFVFK